MSPSSPDYDGFHFQPPLPPGSPQKAAPPPLPQGTPPGTPPSLTPPLPQPLSCVPAALPRDTPPLTPSTLRPEDSAMDEDTLTLEELEEQQRLIWAALEQAEGTNSDPDLPAAGNSGTSSPSRMEPPVPTEQAASKPLEASKAEPEDEPQQVPQAEEPGHRQASSAIELADLTPEAEPTPTDSEGQAQTISSDPAGRLNHSDAPAIPSSAEPPSQTPGLVPDMSKFAAGITPFEYDNMAESTGTYLRIRSALKKYPRNQLKNKKPSL